MLTGATRSLIDCATGISGERIMLTTIEVTIDKSGHLHSVESGQAIKPGRALLTWLEPDTTHEPALMAESALA